MIRKFFIGILVIVAIAFLSQVGNATLEGLKGKVYSMPSIEISTKYPYSMVEIDASIETINEQIKNYQSQVDGFVSNGDSDNPVAYLIRSVIATKQAELEIWQQRKDNLEHNNVVHSK